MHPYLLFKFYEFCFPIPQSKALISTQQLLTLFLSRTSAPDDPTAETPLLPSSPAEPSPAPEAAAPAPKGAPIGLIAGGAAGGAAALSLAVLAGCVLVRRRRRRRLEEERKSAGDGGDRQGPVSGRPTASSLDEPAGGSASIVLSHHGSKPVGKKLSKAWSVASGATLTLPGLQPSGGSDASAQADAAGAESMAGGSQFAERRDTAATGSAAPSPASRLGSAEMVNQVTLYDQLGSGAFGTVYRADWCGRPVAVKVLQMTCRSASAREMDSFRREVEVLSSLKHPNIIQFLAACTVPPNICIIEELAEGGSLHARLHGKPGARRRAPLAYTELLRIAGGIADAMVYLHPKVVHRDLKSQNVLLDARGEALVCDFGIAKYKDRTFVSTANGQAGTPAYMAPEMFDGAGITEKVDVFAFGVLLWEMLTGEVPWSHVPSPMQIIYCVGVMSQRLPIPPACPAALRVLIERCWAEQPADRPGFVEILAELRSEAASITTCPAPPEATSEVSESSMDEYDLSARDSTALGPIDTGDSLGLRAADSAAASETSEPLTSAFDAREPVTSTSTLSAAAVTKGLQLKTGRQPQLGIPSDASSGTPSPFASVAHEAFPDTDTAGSLPRGSAASQAWRGSRKRIPSAGPVDLA